VALRGNNFMMLLLSGLKVLDVNTQNLKQIFAPL